jgi:hypothetical protein
MVILAQNLMGDNQLENQSRQSLKPNDFKKELLGATVVSRSPVARTDRPWREPIARGANRSPVARADRPWREPIARGASRPYSTGDREKMSNGFLYISQETAEQSAASWGDRVHSSNTKSPALL